MDWARPGYLADWPGRFSGPMAREWLSILRGQSSVLSSVTSVWSRVWSRVRPWAPFVIVAALLYFLVITVNPAALIGSVKAFNWLYLLPLTGSYLLYLALRAGRWHLLMQPLKAPNSWTDSLLLFAAA